MNKLPYEIEKVSILVKKKEFKVSKTSPKRKASDLFNFGIIVLDKPNDIKCIHVANQLRDILEQPKLGHAGTLDPKVTGVLPIGLGKATKVLPVLSIAGKVYVGTMKIHDDVSKDKIEKSVENLTGKIIQRPPKISAVKRVEREREVYWAKILKISGRNVEFEMGCQHGTYVRKWVHDIGEDLRCGAHMIKLKRIQAGPYKEKDTVSMDLITENYRKWLKTKKDSLVRTFVKEVETAVSHMPKIWIDDGALDRLKFGSPIYVPGIVQLTSNVKKDREIAMFSLKNELIGFGFAALDAKNLIKAKKGLGIKTDVVLI